MLKNSDRFGKRAAKEKKGLINSSCTEDDGERYILAVQPAYSHFPVYIMLANRLLEAFSRDSMEFLDLYSVAEQEP